MLKIDSHQHFWNYDPVKHSWINEDMAVIRKDFLPLELASVLAENEVNGCVAVQAEHTEEENNFLLQQAADYDFIKGVVGWVDLQSPSVEQRLEHYSQFPEFKGIRHILQGEKQRDLMLQPDFVRGIGALQKFNMTYDLLIFPDQLPFAIKLVSMFPGINFVLNHMSKPDIKHQEINKWKTDIALIAHHENVYCKISGLVTEAAASWKPSDFNPYIDAVVSAFGIKRIMFGSDWPVCLTAASYEQAIRIVDDYFNNFSMSEKQLFFGVNASNFYRLTSDFS